MTGVLGSWSLCMWPSISRDENLCSACFLFSAVLDPNPWHTVTDFKVDLPMECCHLLLRCISQLELT